jgi:hypothetical protein
MREFSGDKLKQKGFFHSERTQIIQQQQNIQREKHFERVLFRLQQQHGIKGPGPPATARH